MFVEHPWDPKICSNAPRIPATAQCRAELDALGYPSIVKPDSCYDSLGISSKSIVQDADHAVQEVGRVLLADVPRWIR